MRATGTPTTSLSCFPNGPPRRGTPCGASPGPSPTSWVTPWDCATSPREADIMAPVACHCARGWGSGPLAEGPAGATQDDLGGPGRGASRYRRTAAAAAAVYGTCGRRRRDPHRQRHVDRPKRRSGGCAGRCGAPRRRRRRAQRTHRRHRRSAGRWRLLARRLGWECVSVRERALPMALLPVRSWAGPWWEWRRPATAVDIGSRCRTGAS